MLRRPRRIDRRHLRFVRDRRCLICGFEPSDPAHIKMADARVLKPQTSNVGMKADDKWVVPLCRFHHDEQHSMPERQFWAEHHLDPVLLALALYACSIDNDPEGADRMLDNARLAAGELR